MHSGARVACGGLFLIAASAAGGASPHPRGVRTLTYAPGTRQLLSTGYESYFQVWDISDPIGCLTPVMQLGGRGEESGQVVPMQGVASLEAPCAVPWSPAANGLQVRSPAQASSALSAIKRAHLHFGQVVSCNERGLFSWWDVSRSPLLTPRTRCLQSFTPMASLLSATPCLVRGLACVRFARSLAEASAGTVSATDSAQFAVVEASGPGLASGLLLLGISNPMNVFECLRQDEDKVQPAAALYHDLSSTLLAACGCSLRRFSLDLFTIELNCQHQTGSSTEDLV